jgi:hypothetical protein
MAQVIPEGPRAMAEVPGLGLRFVQRSGQAIVELLNSPRPAPDWQRPQRRAPGDPSLKKRINRLIEARDAIAGELKIDGSVLCPRATVVGVAENCAAGDVQALEAAGMGGWRLELLGNAFVKALK